MKDVPAHGRGVGLEGLSRSLPTQTILWFSDSRVLWFYDRPGQARQGALLLCSPGPPCPTQPLPGPGTRGGSPAARHCHQHQHWHWHQASASASGFSPASPLLLHCFSQGTSAGTRKPSHRLRSLSSTQTGDNDVEVTETFRLSPWVPGLCW